MSQRQLQKEMQCLRSSSISKSIKTCQIIFVLVLMNIFWNINRKICMSMEYNRPFKFVFLYTTVSCRNKQPHNLVTMEDSSLFRCHIWQIRHSCIQVIFHTAEKSWRPFTVCNFLISTTFSSPKIFDYVAWICYFMVTLFLKSHGGNNGVCMFCQRRLIAFIYIWGNVFKSQVTKWPTMIASAHRIDPSASPNCHSNSVRVYIQT